MMAIQIRRKISMVIRDMVVSLRAAMEMQDRADMDIRERILTQIPIMIPFIRHRLHKQKVKIATCRQ